MNDSNSASACSSSKKKHKDQYIYIYIHTYINIYIYIPFKHQDWLTRSPLTNKKHQDTTVTFAISKDPNHRVPHDGGIRFWISNLVSKQN